MTQLQLTGVLWLQNREWIHISRFIRHKKFILGLTEHQRGTPAHYPPEEHKISVVSLKPNSLIKRFGYRTASDTSCWHTAMTVECETESASCCRPSERHNVLMLTRREPESGHFLSPENHHHRCTEGHIKHEDQLYSAKSVKALCAFYIIFLSGIMQG